MDAVPQPESSLARNLSDLELLDQLLLSGDGRWLEFPGCPDILQAGNSMSPSNTLMLSPLFELNSTSPNQDQPQSCNQDKRRSTALICSPVDESQAQKIDKTPSLNSNSIGKFMCSIQSGDCTRSLRSESSPSVEERCTEALQYIKDTPRDGDVLAQLWVPVKRGGRLILTTYSQPFALNLNCEKLMNYREVSTNYQFSAEENSGEALGLPGRVFVGRLPEWTPDVRFFSSYEYRRVNYAQRLDIRGTIALPVFDQGGRSCMGVVEVVMTTRNINYSFELENICNALQAVDLRSSAVVSIPCFKVSGGSCHAALPEILQGLKAACKRHMLPLAQTWIPCIQQGKKGIRHSNENYGNCVSTFDAACFVNEPSMTGFHEACSEHHLLRGQGVAGRAFTTNQPCFTPDVSACSKIEYPLSHHAKMFGLRSAVAIRLRSVMTDNADFVLEFFLPTNCVLIQEQKLMLDSLLSTLRHACQTLRVVAARELSDEPKMFPPGFLLEKSTSGAEPVQKYDTALKMGLCRIGPPCFTSPTEPSREISSHVFESNKYGIEEFGITTNRDHTGVVLLPAQKITFSKFRQHQQDLAKDISGNESSLNFGNISSDAAKGTRRRRRRAEKSVSLEVLRTYFSGSLKDAAKSIGVCQTTLKKICRRHGIPRWPSRKIKKVGQSLKKLQVVIDSVHGADKAIQLTSLYKDFTRASISDKNSSGDIPLPKMYQNDRRTANCRELEAKLSYPHVSSSHSSSCTQTYSSSLSSSRGTNQFTDFSHGADDQMDLHHLSTQGSQFVLDRIQGQKSLGSLSPDSDDNKSSWIRVKATFGAEKVRVSLHPTWGFRDLKQEILKRFNIGTTNPVDLRYFDDESDWVLLTCDADLRECIHIYRSSAAQTIKVSIQPAVTPTAPSICSTGLIHD